MIHTATGVGGSGFQKQVHSIFIKYSRISG